MTDMERMQVAISVIAQQRNDALNTTAALQAEIADLRQQLEQAKPKDEPKE